MIRLSTAPGFSRYTVYTVLAAAVLYTVHLTVLVLYDEGSFFVRYTTYYTVYILIITLYYYVYFYHTTIEHRR